MAILAADTGFHEHLPLVFPHRPQARDSFVDQYAMREEHARFNTALQIGYFLLGVRAAGLAADELGVEGDDLLDVESHELLLGDRRVKLTKMEFEVFLYLYERENKPVNRVSLIEQVWGAKCTGSNVIEAVVRSLRKKLGDRAAAIETIRNVGYRFRREYELH